VLKDHIAIARAVFPVQTSGVQIDTLARLALWRAGLDFDHETGHGVGSYLSVHEGPQRLAKTGTTPLAPGTIVPNEPGYYAAGAFGIRIENLVAVEARTIAGGQRSMLGFETLALTPIDLSLVEPNLMDAEQIQWLDAYHARVRKTLSSLIDASTRRWLIEATRRLAPRKGKAVAKGGMPLAFRRCETRHGESRGASLRTQAAMLASACAIRGGAFGRAYMRSR
jgi:Xaa-Pro aminopeptidase